MRATLAEKIEQREQPRASIESTYKARDAEGIVDLYFYRKIGFRLAQVGARLHLTPSAVTLIGGVFGILAGHLYFYRALLTNLVGMLMHVFANALDNADGQLARLTNQKSRYGRIFDSFVDHIIWLGIYIHLALRCRSDGAPPTIWLLMIAAIASHAVQAAMADHCRNAFLYFAEGQIDFDSAAIALNEYRKRTWRGEPWQKFLYALYLNATREQEMLAPNTRRLREVADASGGDQIDLPMRYRSLVRPTFKWWGLLMTNTRMLLLFLLLIVRQPIWFFWMELTAFNLLFIILARRQERISRSLVDLVAHSRESN